MNTKHPIVKSELALVNSESEPTSIAKTAAQWVILFIATFAFLAACFYAADKEADAVEKQAIERKANIEKHSAIVGGGE